MDRMCAISGDPFCVTLVHIQRVSKLLNTLTTKFLAQHQYILHPISDDNACTYLARHNKIHALKHLHEQGYTWDERTVSVAIEAGSLRCLEYAHSQGCPYSAGVAGLALRSEKLECLKYAHVTMRCELTEYDLDLTLQAAEVVGIGFDWNYRQCIRFTKAHVGPREHCQACKKAGL